MLKTMWLIYAIIKTKRLAGSCFLKNAHKNEEKGCCKTIDTYEIS
ncbi:MAG: hypothetical protein AWM53_01075 [Candidatus Dichloromethanomonas elyunquensis]|nr:MAG: hypothetical protein AWM53_01075 [Candidatus Dichloromethanomonas elyunquensis]